MTTKIQQVTYAKFDMKGSD